ncbi:hypothetical protein EAI28_14610 [Faecalicatena contorta]|nr:hypothetical protein [Faecalicatena contorta]
MPYQANSDAACGANASAFGPNAAGTSLPLPFSSTASSRSVRTFHQQTLPRQAPDSPPHTCPPSAKVTKPHSLPPLDVYGFDLWVFFEQVYDILECIIVRECHVQF